MKFQGSKLFILIPLLIMQSCSLQRSSGRRQFEEKAAPQIRTDVEGVMQPTNTSCWVQSPEEEFEIPEDSSLHTLEQISEEELEICVSQRSPYY